MAQTASSNLILGSGDHEHYPVLTNTNIYEASAVSSTTAGYARPLLASNTTDKFLGFCAEETLNNPGASGAKNVKVLKRGTVPLAVNGVTLASNVGTKVYASDDNTFTTTSTNNVLIGVVRRVIANGRAMVDFNATTLALL